jgi:hypothetical protein
MKGAPLTLARLPYEQSGKVFDRFTFVVRFLNALRPNVCALSGNAASLKPRALCPLHGRPYHDARQPRDATSQHVRGVRRLCRDVLLPLIKFLFVDSLGNAAGGRRKSQWRRFDDEMPCARHTPRYACHFVQEHYFRCIKGF